MKEQKHLQAAYTGSSANAERESKPGRRSFLWMASLMGAGGTLALGSLLDGTAAKAKGRDDRDDDRGDDDRHDRDDAGAKQQDTDILIAAEIAEALAVTTYTNIINTAPFLTAWSRMTRATSSPRAKKRCPIICWSSL